MQDHTGAVPAYALLTAAGKRLRRAADGLQDLRRHLRGEACQRLVLVHPFDSGARLGFRPSRCVHLDQVTDPWCRLPHRCHAGQPAVPAWWPPSVRTRIIAAYAARHEAGR